MKGVYDSKGSVWHRWDPHLHAPGTLLNDQFKGDWEKYLARIEQSQPRIEALGVTDYFCILGLTRFRGHSPKGGYDVHDGRHKEPTSAPTVRG